MTLRIHETFGPVEQLICRIAATTTGMTLRGYAATYDQPTTKQRDYKGTETIARGAFDGLLGGDVLALRDHDTSKVLGRTSSGTLRLFTDARGLRFEMDLPDTQLGRDTKTLVERGDLNGCSFAAVAGTVERTAGGVVHKKFKRLVDVSIVALPAYDGTVVRDVPRRGQPAYDERVRQILIRQKQYMAEDQARRAPGRR